MFATVRQAYAMLQEETPAPEAAASGEANGGHYLYFQGIPNPPSGYIPPAGASPNTWPAIYNNMQNIDYCTENFSHLGNRIKCLKSFTPGPFLP